MSKVKKVLIVEDEKRMADLIALYLKPYNYSVQKVYEAHTALDYLANDTFDIVLLDIMMPEMSGWELCAEIREFSDIPIIMVTARDQQEDIVKGLKLGADDYLTKPFNEAELLARMEALLRRQAPKSYFEVDGLVWDKNEFKLTYNEGTIPLTKKEFMLLGHFIAHPNQVFGREQLIELLWGFDSDTEGRTVDSHIRNMREKIRRAGFPINDYFETVWGMGYKWKGN